MLSKENLQRGNGAVRLIYQARWRAASPRTIAGLWDGWKDIEAGEPLGTGRWVSAPGARAPLGTNPTVLLYAASFDLNNGVP